MSRKPLLVRFCVACVASVSNRVIARKLEREQKKVEGEGRRGNLVSFVPLPLPRHSFFCSRPNSLDKLARKRLLRRLAFVLWCDYSSVLSFFCMTPSSDWHPPATPKTYFFCTYWLSFINTKRFNVS